MSRTDPQRYLSFGLTLRERVESNDAPFFGVTGATHEVDLLHRLQVYADAHITDHTQVFVQLQNELAPGIRDPSPADANKLDLGLAFVTTWGHLWSGRWRIRVGRQQMAFGLQRFISIRNGPNVQQAYDAIWSDYRLGAWRFSGFFSQPVQYRNEHSFDDFSNRHLTYGGVRVRRMIPHGKVSITFARYRNDSARFLAAAGREYRRIWDVHYTGAAHGFDWDIEGMAQRGRVGAKRVRAWGGGALAGYTFTAAGWKPRLGLQFDAASGDHNLSSTTLETFNPMFPNGQYLLLSGYMGYANFIHLKESVTVRPTHAIRVLGAVGQVWRETTADAVYAIPDIPIPGTVGKPGRFTGHYLQARVDWTIRNGLSADFELDHFGVARVIQAAGGHASNYAEFEVNWGW